MKHGLKEETMARIRGVFAAFPVVEKAVLYGSRAKGNFKPGSDIDLALFGNDLDLMTLHKIEDALDDLLLPYEIDLIIYERIANAELREHIERVGMVFYKREDDRSREPIGSEAAAAPRL